MDSAIELVAQRFGGIAGLTRWILVTALVAARLGPLAVLAPWLGRRALQPAIRTGLVLAVAVSLAPVAAAAARPLPATAVPLVLLLAKEALVGLLLALATTLPFVAFEQAGRLLDTLRGANLAEVLDPLGESRTSPLGALHLQLAVVTFVVLGGPMAVLAALGRSFATFPVTEWPDAGGGAYSALALGAMRLAAASVQTAVAVAAPAGVALLVTEVALGLVERASPNVPVFFVGMPLRAAVGLAFVLLGLALLPQVLPEALRGGIVAFDALVRMLR